MNASLLASPSRASRLLGLALLAIVPLLPARLGAAVTPADLKSRLDAGEKLTLIDIRPNTFFLKGHIPGAINIPAPVVEVKTLPRLGHVVVYDDGLGGDAVVTNAAAALARKPGINAEILEGGFAAWEMVNAETTTGPGISREELPMISYKDLKAAPVNEVVLVDLRQQSSGRAVKSPGVPAAPLTDLKAEFPGAAVTASPFQGGRSVRSLTGGGKPPLLVLIDKGDGTAEKMARALKANGVKRFVILAGGEEILARRGEKGLQRAGVISVETGGESVPANLKQ